jgi:hypothetical protein
MRVVVIFNYTGVFALKLRKTHRKLKDGTRKVPGTFLSTLSPFCEQPGLQIPIHFRFNTRAALPSPQSASRALQVAETEGISRTTQIWVATVPKRPDVEGKKVYTPIPSDLLVTNVPSCSSRNVKTLQF